eukprot:364632-Chlamydomonas_euryale.AAC.2
MPHRTHTTSSPHQGLWFALEAMVPTQRPHSACRPHPRLWHGLEAMVSTQRPQVAPSREVFAAVANKNYLWGEPPMMKTFTDGIKRAKIENHLVLALDDEMKAWCDQNGINVHRLNLKVWAQGGAGLGGVEGVEWLQSRWRGVTETGSARTMCRAKNIRGLAGAAVRLLWPSLNLWGVAPMRQREPGGVVAGRAPGLGRLCNRKWRQV